MQNEQLPEVKLYGIGAAEADTAAALLTAKAVAELKNETAFGMALVEEDELRAAVCARLQPDNEAVLELLSLYVVPSARRKKLGGTLLMELVEHVMTMTDASIQAVTASFSEDMEGLEALFTKAGFQIEAEEDLALWRVSLEHLEQSPLMQHVSKMPKDHLLSKVADISDIGLRRLSEELQKNGVEDLTAAEMRQAMQQASYVLFKDTQEPKACAIITAEDLTHVYLSQFFTVNGNVPDGMTVLQAAARALLAQYSDDEKKKVVLEIPTLTQSSAGLVKKLLAPEAPVRTLRAVWELY